VDDKNIELGSVASPTDATADGGGITLKGATDKTILWQNSDDRWHFNQSVALQSSTPQLKIGSSAAEYTVFGVDGASGLTAESVGGPMAFTSAGNLSLDAAASLNLNTQSSSASHAINLGTENKPGPVNIATAGTRDLNLGTTTTTTVLKGDPITLDSAGRITLLAAGYISVNSSANLTLETDSNTHTISLGAENKNGPINIGTAGARTISVGSGSATEIDLTAATIDVNGDVEIAGDASLSDGSVTIAKDTDADFVALTLTNQSDASDTTGKVSIQFDLHGTDTVAVDAGKIQVSKEVAFIGTDPSEKAEMQFQLSQGGTLSEKMTLASTGNLSIDGDLTVGGGDLRDVDGAIGVTLSAASGLGAYTLIPRLLVVGDNTANDVGVTFAASPYDGWLTWMADEDYFKFLDDVLIDSGEKLYFDSTSEAISSDGTDLTVESGGAIILSPTTTLTVAGATGLTGNLTQSGGTVSLSSNGAATVNAAGYVAVTSSANLMLETDSNTHAISLGAENKNGPINIGTAGSRTISVGSGSATEIDLTATTIDVNGAVDISGALTVGGNIIKASDGGSTITMDTSDNVTIAGALTATGGLATLSLTAEQITGDGSGTDVASPTVPISFVYTNGGSSAISLADGGSTVLRKIFYLAAAGNDAVITPANLGAGSTITLDAVADRVELLWLPSPGSTWVVFSGYGYDLV